MKHLRRGDGAALRWLRFRRYLHQSLPQCVLCRRGIGATGGRRVRCRA